MWRRVWQMKTSHHPRPTTKTCSSSLCSTCRTFLTQRSPGISAACGPTCFLWSSSRRVTSRSTTNSPFHNSSIARQQMSQKARSASSTSWSSLASPKSPKCSLTCKTCSKRSKQTRQNGRVASMSTMSRWIKVINKYSLSKSTFPSHSMISSHRSYWPSSALDKIQSTITSRVEPGSLELAVKTGHKVRVSEVA